MTLLERFRSQARDKHPDPLIRLAFVQELPLSEHAMISALAREDEDPRVRKAAVGKLIAPADLAEIARDDKDDNVRALATSMLRDIALEAFEDVNETQSFEAVDLLSDPRTLAQVARSSTRSDVALRALARIHDTKGIGAVARHGLVEAVRTTAFSMLAERNERAEILAVALNGDFKDTAIAAVEAAGDRADLDHIIARSKNKNAVKRARAIVREIEEQAAREAAQAAEQARAAATEAAEAVAHRDREAAEAARLESEAARVASDEARRVEKEAERAEHRKGEALRDAEHAAVEERETESRRARLSALVEEAAVAHADETFKSALRRFDLLRREWQTLSTGVNVDPELAGRFAELDAQMTARETREREAEAKARREALGRMHNLLGRVEPLASKPDMSLKAADRALRDVKAAIAAIPTLPTKQDADDVSQRLKAALEWLSPKVDELQEADEWRRFSNVAIQERLCAQMEALINAEDLDRAARDVHALQVEWRSAADVPRAQADVLWRRFKVAHDAVWSRCEAHFAAQAIERAQNLEKKVELCAKAEALADSTNWIQTADSIKGLQAEWKTIGPVSRGKEKAIWDRFRSACDRFFTRRHDDLLQRKSVWAENLAKKDALCARAETLAESTDWDEAAAEIRALQVAWKAVGPVKKTKSDAIWHRFRAACDKFFSRYAQRHDVARAERAAAREALAVELEALAAAAEPPSDLATTLRTIRGRWQQEAAARGVEPERARALSQRFSAAFAAVTSKWPSALAGTELDPDANRKKMEALVRRMEDLAGSLGRERAVDESLSPTVKLAAMLKEALAANTIGGKVDDAARFSAALEEMRQAQAAWTRIGPVPEPVQQPLADRFQRAVRLITERAGGSGRAARPGR